jgi:polysaccharide pyruvyl transferase WcaK-like protein
MSDFECHSSSLVLNNVCCSQYQIVGSDSRMDSMIREGLEEATGSLQLAEPENVIPSSPSHATEDSSRQHPRIALLTPYTGGNLGDAAIQDAAILNLRQRLPNVKFSGITLKCANFLAQHGSSAFPLVGAGIPFFRMEVEGAFKEDQKSAGVLQRIIRRVFRHIPGAGVVKRSIKLIAHWWTVAKEEIGHAIAGYRFLRAHDLLLISGGGQLDEEYGGAWGLPYAIFKWALLARLARVPCAMASVGAGRISLPFSRKFISGALRLCCYRSFRETSSRAIAARLYARAMNDAVVPDLAFSLPREAVRRLEGKGIRAMARGRSVIALSPMAYAKPGDWPTPKRDLYDRYVDQLARLLPCLTTLGYFVVVVCSSRGDDESVISGVLNRLSDEAKRSLDGNIHYATAKTWKEFVAVVRETDCLVASRLHGVILGFIAQVPAIAISVDPKIDWVMEDLQQTDFLLHFRDFTAEDILDALERLNKERAVVVEQIDSYRESVLSNPVSGQQYDVLVGLALKHCQV